ncbi:transglycosylase domain-containing protein [Carnobacterium sp. CS13]|uniref:transglycosylase domain-containing protein n=3 Tax=unclassified Carnobacterium TaxID=257487 RepID=UPI001F22C96C|nr:transglycosylase domain-containing protein [Carnobacterium sp. CS13]
MKEPKRSTTSLLLEKVKTFFIDAKQAAKKKWVAFKQKQAAKKETTDKNSSQPSNAAEPSVDSAYRSKPKTHQTEPETLDDKFIAFLLAIKGWVVMKWRALKKKFGKKTSKGKHRQTKDEKNPTSSENSLFFGFNVGYTVFKNLFITLIVVILMGVAFGGGAGLGYFAYLVSNDEPPTYEEMKADIENLETTSSAYYAGGELISDLKTDLKRIKIPLADMSPLIQNAIIATEDEYFYDHEGVVPKAVVRALAQEVSGATNVSGGSTLTQQLVKQQILTNEVSFKRKANEILLAFRLENYFSKDEILEAYLNVSPFGRNNHGENIAGLQEATSGIFGVAPNEVSLPQAAFIAGLPQNPIVYSPYTQYGEIKEDLTTGMARKDEVLFRMYREGYISEDEYNEAKNYDLAQDFIQQDTSTQQKNSYLYDKVEKEARKIIMEKLYTADKLTASDLAADKSLYDEYYEKADQEIRMKGFKINTTIDKPVYEAMQNVVTNNAGNLGYQKEVEWTNPDTGEVVTIIEPVQNGSVLMNNATGAILSFIGGVDFEVSQVNHAFDTQRSPGSTIKPLLVYAPALENGTITPATIVPQTTLVVPDGVNGTHEITNDGGSVPNTWISSREGLAKSSNLVTSRIYLEMQKSFVPGEYLPKMGIGTDSISEEEYANPSLAIGGTEHGATVLEQTNAFATLANNGTHTESYMIESIENSAGDVIYQHETKSNQVFSPQTAYLTIDMMRDVLDAGTATEVKGQLNFSADLAGKTGTSEEQKDIWFIASTPEVTLSSWIGYDNSIEGVTNYLNEYSGVGSAGRRNRAFWSQLANAINSANPSIMGANKSFQQPEGIVSTTVNDKTGMKAGKVKLGNGKETTVSGETKTEIFNSKYLPGTTTYNFAIGANAKELQDYWGGLASSEAKAKMEQKGKADAKAKAESEKAKADADAKAKAESEKVKADADAKTKAESEKAKADADAKAKAESEKAKADADAKAKAESEKAKADADAKAKAESEKAKADADAKAKAESEKAKADADAKAKAESEKAKKNSTP